MERAARTTNQGGIGRVYRGSLRAPWSCNVHKSNENTQSARVTPSNTPRVSPIINIAIPEGLLGRMASP